MMDRSERRLHRRLEAQHEISCRIVGSAKSDSYSGHTANVSSGGLYFQTTGGRFERGDLLKLELSLPPTPGVLEFGGKLAGFGKVLRTDVLGDDAVGGKLGVAVEFCRPLRLCR